MSTNRYYTTIATLCKRHKITQCSVKTLKEARADIKQRIIHIIPPDNIKNYTAAMHEIGHIVHPEGSPSTFSDKIPLSVGKLYAGWGPKRIKYEIYAWIWSFEESFLPLDKETCIYALTTYIKKTSPEAMKINKLAFANLNRIAGTNF